MISLQYVLNSAYVLAQLIAVSVVFVVILSAFLGAYVLAARSFRRTPSITVGIAWMAFPASVVGVIVGFLSGLSREPVVAALVPAMVTLVSGAGVYLVGKGLLKALQVTYMVTTFTMCLLLGVGIGSQMREVATAAAESVTALKAQADREFRVSRYRTSLGLSPTPPKNEKNEKEE
jgi:hypothetical protein